MKAIATLCKVSSGRGGKKNENLGSLNFAKKDKPAQDNILPELETYFMAQERSLGLNKTQYENFVYLIKRYSYKGTPLQEHMMKEISPLLGLDYEKLSEENADKHTFAYMMVKNHEIFQQGSYNIEILQCLGFLSCQHHDRQSRMDEFWQLINPEINDDVSFEKVIDTLRIFIYLAIVLRLKIEKSRTIDDQNNDAINYLQKVGAQSYSIDEIQDSTVFKLMGMREDQRPEEGKMVNYQELFQLVSPSRCLTAFDIRMNVLQ